MELVIVQKELVAEYYSGGSAADQIGNFIIA
jgi:hypothetical protein